MVTVYRMIDASGIGWLLSLCRSVNYVSQFAPTVDMIIPKRIIIFRIIFLGVSFGY